MNTTLLKELIYSIVEDVPDSLYNMVDEDDTGKGYSIVTKDYTACFHIDDNNKFSDLTIKRITDDEQAEKIVKTFKFIDSLSDDEKTALS